MSLALHPTRPSVGILDLDIFGPSIPKLMSLENIEDLSLSPGPFPPRQSDSFYRTPACAIKPLGKRPSLT